MTTALHRTKGHENEPRLTHKPVIWEINQSVDVRYQIIKST